MIVVVPVLVFVSFSFGEVSMDSPVQSKCIGIIARAFWWLTPLKIKVSGLLLVYEAVCTSYHMGRTPW